MGPEGAVLQKLPGHGREHGPGGPGQQEFEYVSAVEHSGLFVAGCAIIGSRGALVAGQRVAALAGGHEHQVFAVAGDTVGKARGQRVALAHIRMAHGANFAFFKFVAGVATRKIMRRMAEKDMRGLLRVTEPGHFLARRDIFFDEAQLLGAFADGRAMALRAVLKARQPGKGAVRPQMVASRAVKPGLAQMDHMIKIDGLIFAAI